MPARALLLVVFALCASLPAPALAQSAPGVDSAAVDLEQLAAGIALDDPLPIDPSVRVGRLENGLTYFIRHNDEPANRAELRLALDAGSVLEDEDQLGLAHFTEHMLFNGTRRFPESALVDFLESTGMRFGPDVNAYTSFDETVYMLTIPTDSADIVQNAFAVLEDWAAFATLSDEEIDKERGVVLEEWRLSDQNAQGRVRDEILPAILHGSRYKDRLPIGKPEIIEQAGYDTVRRFYRDWYRPELMAVVVVGDLDPDRAERLIREHFAHLTNPEEPRPRPTFEVPGHEETIYEVATDPELTSTSVTVYYKRKAEAERTVADYREQLVGALFNNMLNDRFRELAREASAPFLGARAFRGGFVRPAEFYGLMANVQEDSVLAGLEALVREAARVREHGFTETELERARAQLLRAYRSAYEERGSTESESFAREYVGHFLEEEPIPGIAYEYAVVRKYLPTVTVDEVDRLADDLLAAENRAVVVTMPEKEGLTPASEAALAGVLERVDEMELAPYDDAVTDDPLIPAVPEAAPIAERTEIDTLGVTEVRFANGVRVVMKPTDFKEDEVRFTAFSEGGSSLVSDEDVFEAEMAPMLVVRSGLGTFTRTELEKKLAGKVVSVTPYVGELDEGLRGSASPEDLETLFQLIYLYVTAPRADSAALVTFQNQWRSYLENRAANPSAVFSDSLQAALYGPHPRRQPPAVRDVETLDLGRALASYRERFAHTDDLTFVFVGNFDVDRLTELARTYLGTLPDAPGGEEWRDVYPELPDRTLSVTVHEGLGDQSQVLLLFHGPFEYTREDRHAIQSMGDVLSIMLREKLREELGGTYGVGARATTTDEPDATYTFAVNFGADPARVPELIEAVFSEVERLKTEGPSEEDVAKVREQQRRSRETALETNDFWLDALAFYYERPGEPVVDILTYGALLGRLTPELVQQAAQRYLDRDRFVRAILYPEGFDAAAATD